VITHFSTYLQQIRRKCPSTAHEAVEQGLVTLDFLEEQIESAKHRLQEIMKVSAGADPLKKLFCETKAGAVPSKYRPWFHRCDRSAWRA
jgi:hypothetical protein